MSEKMTCPACDAYTSDVRTRYLNDEPCPYCGLSAEAADAVMKARTRKANTDLTEQLTQAIVRADRAEAEAARLRQIIDEIKQALEAT